MTLRCGLGQVTSTFSNVVEVVNQRALCARRQHTREGKTVGGPLPDRTRPSARPWTYPERMALAIDTSRPARSRAEQEALVRAVYEADASEQETDWG